MKRLMKGILLSVLILALTVPVAAADAPSQWCEQAPMALYHDLFVPAEHAGLNTSLTRAMAASILAGYEGAYADASALSASDVDSASWYAPGAAWAVSAGVMELEDGAFLPDRPLNRQELCAVLYAYLRATDKGLPFINEKKVFSDEGSVSFELREAVTVIQRGGVIIEDAGGYFGPLNNVTVSEAERIFLRFFGGMFCSFRNLPVSTTTVHDPVDDSWFDDACFIGHSQVVGMKKYGGPSNIDYFAVVGFTAQDVLNFPYFGGHNGWDDNITNVLKVRPYGKVFIMLGINDCSNKADRVDRFMTPMRRILDIVRETNPDATIYLLSLVPVGRETPMNVIYNPENCVFYSQMIKTLSREYGTEYIDMFRFMSDSDGYFIPEVNSPDGIHIDPKYYPTFVEYLRCHV